jgi:serine/threonine protein kinase/tetratricopeptide (TPR) repeat protein
MVNDDARVKSVFLAAIERYPATHWPAYLDGACGEDSELRDRVQRLLEAHGGQKSLHIPSPSEAEVTVDQQIVERPGATIGAYKLMEQIGEGGMGIVYVAEQTQPVRRRAALKIIKPGMDSRQVVARFEAERQALAMMDHPNIARVFDGGTTASGRPYFVMELVRGIPMTDYCDRERLSIPQRLELFAQVCRAVQHAHQKGVIHRDLKPSNILVTVIDGAGVPKVIDFRVAKATGASLTERTLYTAFHQFIGTPLYMSPEQADLSGMDVDTRSDIYSLGVLLYELLTGTTPFDQETFRTAALDEFRKIIREQEPPTPSHRISSLAATQTTISANRASDPRRLHRMLRGELDWIVMKALEKDRRRRYETASAFAADIERYCTGMPVEACPPSAWYRLGKTARRNRVWLTTGALIVGALVVGVSAALWQAVRATRAERNAEQRYDTARKTVDEMYTEVAEKWLAQREGLEPLQRDFLLKALAFYEEFARDHRDSTVARAAAAEAARRAGNIRRRMGELDQAQQAYHLGIEINGLLVREFPTVPAYKNNLALCKAALAALSLDRGRLSEAEAGFRAARAVFESLAAEFPSVHEYRLHLGQTDGDLGPVFVLTGRYDDAERVTRSAIETLGELMVAHPDDARYRNELAAAYENLGIELFHSDRPADAEQALSKALELDKAIEADLRATAQGRYSLAMRQVYFGASSIAMKGLPNLRRAEAAYRRALPILERLTAESPLVPLYRVGRESCEDGLAVVLRETAQFGEAERMCVRAIKTAEGLVNDFPSTPGYRHNLAMDQERAATVYMTLGKYDDGIRAFDLAKAGYQALVAEFPNNREHRRHLANLHNDISWYMSTCREPRLRDPARAIEEARSAIRLNPRLGDAWSTLGTACYRAGRWADAIHAMEKAMPLRSGGDSFDFFIISLACWRTGRQHDALDWREKAVAWMEKNRPDDVVLLEFRAEADALMEPDRAMPLGADAFAKE